MQARLIDALRRGFRPASGPLPWVLVVGDLMLDRYLWGSVDRVSPEAPVPVVLLDKESARPGGAANVAANLASLGLPCRVVGAVGEDESARRLIEAMAECGVGTRHLVHLPERPTITKTRIVGGHQQMLRVDRESSSALSAQELGVLQQALEAAMADAPAAVILSDYAKGVLHPELCRSAIRLAKRANIPVLVDPKGRDFSKYTGATALTPNRHETSEVCSGIRDIERLLDAADALRHALGLEFLAVTRSEEGITLIEAHRRLHIPAMARQVFDVSGAGDTVIATLTAGLVAGLDHVEALHLANLAAGVVVGKVGTAAITREELLEALVEEETREQADKVCELPRLLARIATWRSAGQRIVFTNGCFDLLHAGHVTYLETARKLGDRLVVGLNTDRSVRALKGPGRPVIHEQDRARVLAALEAVDAVILFDEDTPLNLINAVKPDVLAKGSDYTEDQVVGGKEVKSWGGRVVLVPLLPGRSTSSIIDKIG
ncbi:MAG: bifunctional D-glycero-beta-D-manno-heptose-7-phosphate kinase/D-glycero-beta-D-manno-heptose 1-phosphate adenylyltransferase HldE [Methylophilaceae bacterium]|nr:bifunctional D-glycero-beta-D-manno-heptose-7-phosphate kinase/D-glycero-beta-D-manno-heptose 1-phosphate adenylyltransferase HldE [Methylophilaceae bacterium]